MSKPQKIHKSIVEYLFAYILVVMDGQKMLRKPEKKQFIGDFSAYRVSTSFKHPFGAGFSHKKLWISIPRSLALDQHHFVLSWWQFRHGEP